MNPVPLEADDDVSGAINPLAKNTNKTSKKFFTFFPATVITTKKGVM
jgi:hypothetical protein